MGSMAQPTKRSGCATCAALAASLKAAERREPVAPSAQYTIGTVSESDWTATPWRFIERMRRSRSQ